MSYLMGHYLPEGGWISNPRVDVGKGTSATCPISLASRFTLSASWLDSIHRELQGVGRSVGEHKMSRQSCCQRYFAS